VKLHFNLFSVESRCRPARRAPPPGIPGLMSRRAGAWVVVTGHPTASLHALTGWALRECIGLEALTIARRSPEEVYLELTSAAADPEMGR
jgi:hypothetical protein